eukprot:scaffold14195_cov65-Cyclotella_meneghiniana.AAC.2
MATANCTHFLLHLLFVSLMFLITTTSALSTETFYRIANQLDHAQSPILPSEILIEIHNPKPPATHWYSITIESAGRYSGRAKLLGASPRPSAAGHPPTEPLVYSWTPPFSGDYNILVHELAQEPQRSDTTKPIAPIQSIKVENKPQALGPWGLMIDRMKVLPPCQSVQRTDIYTKWDGDWVGPGMNSPEDTLRNKWFFLPNQDINCKIETFTPRDFQLLQEERRIYILGNSKERGIFLSLVDILLDENEKSELRESVISQCWGRSVVTKNNLQIMYQDWRSDNFDTRTNIPTVVCHNEKVAREGGPLFYNSGRQVWDEIFRGDKSTWPHVILMSTGNDIYGFKGELYDINDFVKLLPSTWDGTLFFTDGSFSARLAGRGYANNYESYQARLQELSSVTNDPRVRWVDGMGWSKDMIMYGEFGPDHTSFSQHFHSHCDETYEDENGEVRSMRICSNVTENIAQLLIGHAVGPKLTLMANASPLSAFRPAKSSSEVVMCHNCPKDLLPFHITPFPDMTCTAGPLHPRTDDEIAGQPQRCPDECMEVEVKRQFGSQTDQIFERHCPYNFFPKGFQVGNDAMRRIGGLDDGEIGFTGHLVWLFNVMLILSLLGYRYRVSIRSHLIKILDPASKV